MTPPPVRSARVLTHTCCLVGSGACLAIYRLLPLVRAMPPPTADSDDNLGGQPQLDGSFAGAAWRPTLDGSLPTSRATSLDHVGAR